MVAEGGEVVGVDLAEVHCDEVVEGVKMRREE